MCGLALALARNGVQVTGSDDLDPYGETMGLLAAWGTPYHVDFDPSHGGGAAGSVMSRQYGRGNVEVESVLERHLKYYSLPQFILEHFLHGNRNAVVAGTKGKTTTTAMLAWILER